MWSCLTSFGGHPWGIGTIIFIAILVALAVVLVRAFTRRTDNRSHIRDKVDSLAILKVRLARGEISVEEYERLRTYL